MPSVSTSIFIGFRLYFPCERSHTILSIRGLEIHSKRNLILTQIKNKIGSEDTNIWITL